MLITIPARTVNIDPVMWTTNYGVPADEVERDATDHINEAVLEGVKEFIRRTGNTLLPRDCYHADESFVNDDGKFLVIRVREDESGYWSMPNLYFDDLAGAKSQATVLNVRAGLTTQDVQEIRESSMRKHFMETYAPADAEIGD